MPAFLRIKGVEAMKASEVKRQFKALYFKVVLCFQKHLSIGFTALLIKCYVVAFIVASAKFFTIALFWLIPLWLDIKLFGFSTYTRAIKLYAL